MAMIDVLAIDLDGTLLGRDKAVSRANIEAIDRARQAGVDVLICTGRGLAESRLALRAIGQELPVMVAGGSIVADPVSGETLHRIEMGADLVHRAVELFHSAQSAAMVLKDPSSIGYDYLIVDSEDEFPVHDISRWWFEDHGIQTRSARSVHHDEHPEHTVRVGMCAEVSRSNPVTARVLDEIGGQVELHDFPCVKPDGHAGEEVHILEIFDKRATKWNAIDWYLQKQNIDPTRVAAIGDQVNDLTMIHGAGIGIAMGNAIDEVKDGSSYVTASNDEDGVAVAIECLLSGDVSRMKSRTMKGH
ncbi:MAG: HAD hydrolase family protein [Phycisphaerales bacterium]|nr:HAD hydrolase family protein [Phycisphaerales bacterium]